ncbi:hypothetical protein [Nevskia sp.]|uniref:hypothetical protein n=1 Tax=Nevskia sp. TaxID=1929292 RepID=UPI0025D70524|nr:hypothetical protein [Nevskia sp.]
MTFHRPPERRRHTFSRYDPGVPGVFLPRRMEFIYWVRAPGPTEHPYWRRCPRTGDLILTLSRGEFHVMEIVPRVEMLGWRTGWRSFIALNLRMMRRQLRYAAQAGASR